jgi:hypothetical protein
MRSHGRMMAFVFSVSVIVATLPEVALAGKKTVSGQQTLQIKAHLTPSRAGAAHVAFGFRYQYQSTQPGQQPPYNAKTITLVMPRGLVLNPAAAPACKRSLIDKANGDVSKCPSKTIVGHGTVLVNAAPTIAAPITGTATIYNAVDDLGIGQPKGTRNLVLWVKTSLGITQAVPFRVLKRHGGHVELRAQLQQPSTPGVSPGSFTIQSVALSISYSGRKSYITDPPTCRGAWPFSLTITNYFGQPSITAHDSVKCRS